MKRPMTKLRAAAALFLLLAGFTGLFAQEDLALVNTETLSLRDTENLFISYRHDTVTLRESDSGDLVIREYMNRDNSRYYADVSRSAGTLRIKRGRRPWFFGSSLKVRLEIYLPPSFHGNLRIANSSGIFQAEMDILNYKSIDLSVSSGSTVLNRLSGETVSVRVSSGDLNVAALEGRSFVSVSSGKLRINELTGPEHRVKISSGRAMLGLLQGSTAIEISSGTMLVDEVRGTVNLKMSSGSLSAGAFSGEGSFELSSGDLNLNIGELNGDLRFRLSSGTVDINIPAALSFNLDARTNSGEVRITGGGEETLRIRGNSSVLRPAGPTPESAALPVRTIYARTSSGTIMINRR